MVHFKHGRVCFSVSLFAVVNSISQACFIFKSNFYRIALDFANFLFLFLFNALRRALNLKKSAHNGCNPEVPRSGNLTWMCISINTALVLIVTIQAHVCSMEFQGQLITNTNRFWSCSNRHQNYPHNSLIVRQMIGSQHWSEYHKNTCEMWLSNYQ